MKKNKKFATALILAMGLGVVNPVYNSYASNNDENMVEYRENSTGFADNLNEKNLENEVGKAQKELDLANENLKAKEIEKIELDKKVLSLQNELNKANENKKKADNDFITAYKKQSEASDDYINLNEKKNKQVEADKNLAKAKEELNIAKNQQEKANENLNLAQKNADEKKKALDLANNKLDEAKKNEKAQEDIYENQAKKKASDALEKKDKAKKDLDQAQKNSDNFLENEKEDLTEKNKNYDNLKSKVDDSRNLLNSHNEDLDKLYASIKTYETDKTDISDKKSELKQKLLKAKEEINWLSPTSDGYKAKQKEIDDLNKQIEEIDKICDKITGDYKNLNEKTQNELDKIKDYNGNFDDLKKNIEEKSKANAKNMVIQDILDKKLTNDNLKEKADDAKNKLGDLYLKRNGKRHDYEMIKDEYHKAWMKLAHASEVLEGQKNIAYDSSRDEIFKKDAKKLIKQYSKEFEDNLAILKEKLPLLKEKADIYLESMAEVEQAEAYAKALENANILLEQVDKNKENLKNLTDSFNQANAQYEKAQKELEDAKNLLDSKKKESEANKNLIAKANEDLNTASENLNKTKIQKENADKKVKELEDLIKNLTNNLPEKIDDGKINEAKEKYNKAKNEAQKAQKMLENAQKEEDEIKARLNKAQDDKAQLQKDIDKAKDDLDLAKDNLKNKKDALALQKEKESIQKAKASLENLLKTSKKINDKNLNKVIEEIEKALKGENLTINDILSLNNKLTDALNNVKAKQKDQTHTSNNPSDKEKNKNRPDEKNKKHEDKNNRKTQGRTSPKTGIEGLSFVGTSLALSLSALFALKKKRK